MLRNLHTIYAIGLQLFIRKNANRRIRARLDYCTFCILQLSKVKAARILENIAGRANEVRAYGHALKCSQSFSVISTSVGVHLQVRVHQPRAKTSEHPVSQSQHPRDSDAGEIEGQRSREHR